MTFYKIICNLTADAVLVLACWKSSSSSVLIVSPSGGAENQVKNDNTIDTRMFIAITMNPM